MKTSIPKRDRWIIAIALLIVFGASYTLVFVNDDDGLNDRSEILGEVSNVNKDVRHKVSSRYDWRDSHKNQKIGLGDQIFTGKNSNAIVSFANNQKLTIMENSLIKFDSRPGEPLKIQVLSGEFKAQLAKNQKIEIEICGEKHLVEAQEQANFSIQNSKNCENVSVISDQENQKNIKIAKKDSPQRQTASVKSDSVNQLNSKLLDSERVRFEKEKADALAKEMAAKKPLDIVQLDTPNKAVRSSEKLTKISWNKVERAEKYSILVSSNDQFTESTNYETQQNYYDLPMNQADKVFYKVKAVSELSQSPDYSQSGLRYVSYPPLQFDQIKHQLSYDAKTSDEPLRPTQIQINWKPVTRITEYKLETSRDEKFSSTDKVYSTASTKLTLPIDQTGHTFYRLKGYNKDGLLVSQTKQVGQVEYTRNFDLSEPQISDDSKKITLFFQKSDGQFIKLKWKNAHKEKASQYYIEISNVADFSRTLYTLKANKESLLIDYSLPVGQYYWRVKSFNNAMVSNWSQTATINILSARQTASEKKK